MKNLQLFSLICLLSGFLLLGCNNSEPDQPIQKEEVSSPPAVKVAEVPEKERRKDERSANSIIEDYHNTDRLVWQKPAMILELLGDLENKVVADIGAGTGFFAFKMVPQADKVIAIDIEKKFLDYMDSLKLIELPQAMHDRLETRLATPNDPNLEKGEVDLILIVNTLAFIPNRIKYLEGLRSVLPEGGKLLVVDFKKKRTTIGPPSRYRIPLYEVEENMYKAKFKKVTAYDTFLSYQYILLAEN